MADDRSLHTEFLRPLHARPVEQCQCGQWLAMVRCDCPFPEAPHAPDGIVEACKVCTPAAVQEDIPRIVITCRVSP